MYYEFVLSFCDFNSPPSSQSDLPTCIVARRPLPRLSPALPNQCPLPLPVSFTLPSKKPFLLSSLPRPLFQIPPIKTHLHQVMVEAYMHSVTSGEAVERFTISKFSNFGFYFLAPGLSNIFKHKNASPSSSNSNVSYISAAFLIYVVIIFLNML